MITAKPRLYYNTGIKWGYCLAYKSLLDTKTYRDFDDHVGLQDYFLTSFKLKADWDDVKNADYMKFGNGYYWIKPQMINENCALIHCTLDPITTIGGALACDYDGGIIKRAHPKAAQQNDYYANMCDEPVGCSQILRAIPYTFNMTAQTATVNAIASTVDLSDTTTSLSPNTEQDALVFSGEIGLTSNPEKYTVVIPKAPAPAIATQYRAFGSNYFTQGFGLYDASNATVQHNLEYIRSLGLSDCILFSYIIPQNMIFPITISANGHIDAIGQSYYQTPADLGWRGATTLDITDDMPSMSGQEQFYKCFSLYTSYIIRGRLSGDMKEFKASEIRHPSTSSIEFSWNADPQYGGTSYCAPSYYQQSDDPYLRIGNAVKGLPWKETPIAIGGATNELWSRNQYAMANSERVRSGSTWDYLQANAGTGIMSNLSGLTVTLWDMARGAINPNYQAPSRPMNLDPKDYLDAKTKAEYLQNQVQAPLLTSSPAIGLQSFIQNGFDIFHVCPVASDIVNINEFFKRYGYAQPNIKFDKSWITSRNDFNYIEVADIKIRKTASTVDVGKSIIEAAQAQLEGGVTILHSL